MFKHWLEIIITMTMAILTGCFIGTFSSEGVNFYDVWHW